MGIINDPIGKVSQALDMPKYIWSTVSSAWERDVVNGDAKSRTAFFTFGLIFLGIGILGDKGIGKAGTIAKTVRQAGKGEKALPNYTPVQTPALAGGGLAQGQVQVPYNVLFDPLTDDVFGVKGANKDIKNYRKTFFDEYPELEGSVIVHHAIEQQVLKKYPDLFTLEEIHALKNLRGIPKEINSDIHLSKIRKDWNRFYRNHPNPTKEDLINYMIELDRKYGENFNPPIKK